MDNDENRTQQENNQLLLNAIKQKSANRKNGDMKNGAIFKPKQFVIPPLRVPPTAAASIQTKTTSIAAAVAASSSTTTTTTETIKDTKAATHSAMSPSPLNQFVLNHLRQKNINGLSDGFKLPELKVPGGSSNKKTFNIPLLNRLHEDKTGLSLNCHHIEKGLQNLSIKPRVDLKELKQQIEIPCPIPSNTTDDILIDLTSALIINPNDTKSTNRPAASETKRSKESVWAKNGLDFKIPHIDCDRRKMRKRNWNEPLCTMNVTLSEFNHKSAKPSALGEALSATDKCPSNVCFPCAATPFEKLHLKLVKRSDYGKAIKRFRFDTKSPDDLVKEALAECLRISQT